MRSMLVAVSIAALFGSMAGSIAQEEPAKPEKKFGGLTEEEFAKLHTLKDEDKSPTKGTMVDLADGSKAYLSLPDGWKEGGPAMIVIHEWWGLNSHIKHWADRFTGTGRAALAVDLYDGKVVTDRKEAAASMRAVDDTKAIATLKAAMKFLKDDPKVKAGKRGSIGWCFGGGMSLQLALNDPGLDACVMYYGRLVNDEKELAKIKSPLLGIFAERDESIPPAAVEVFDKKLTAAGVPHSIHEYDAAHAFANPSGRAYDSRAAAAAWEKVTKFLDEKVPVAAAK